MSSKKPEIELFALDRMKERQAIMSRPAKETWLVEDIFEAGEIHQLSGPSGVGKTTWMLDTMKTWSEGKPILGHRSFPRSFAYIVCDRSFMLTTMTLARLGLQDWNVPMFTIDELRGEIKETVTIAKIAELLPKIDVLFIEAIGIFEPTQNGKASGYVDTMNYWAGIRQVLAKGKSIIATNHSPKTKGKERYGHSRERILGSVAHGASIATTICFDFEDENNSTDMNRIISISPRNSPNMVLRYGLDELGRFVYKSVFEGDETENTKSIHRVLEEMRKSNIRKGEILTRDTFEEWKDKLDISTPTMSRIKKDLCNAKILLRKSSTLGTYEVLESPEHNYMIQ